MTIIIVSRDIFKNAYLPYRDPETLKLFLKTINEFHYTHSEDLGDAFEYLLSVLSSQGDAGQFRTPRHIIDFIVAVVDPRKEDTVLDPACGTAGFLISSYKHILASNTVKTSGDLLSQDERNQLLKNFVGYDISPDMVRLSLVNLYLHGFVNPQIYEYDTLTSEERWNDYADVIIANPPFMSPKGGIKPHKRFTVPSSRSEVLFVDYIMNHLRPNGRAGIIVPEGIIFQSGSAYKTLRKNLVTDGLYAVVSMPSGVFQPYSGVKTSILLFDNDLAKQTKEILFVKVESDGFDLGAQHRPTTKNDLPYALEIIKSFQNQVIESTSGTKQSLSPLYLLVPKSKIAENGDYNLSGDRYCVTKDYSHAKWPMVKLGEVAEVVAGQSPDGKFYNDEGDGLPFYQGKTEFQDKFIGSPKKWTTQVTKEALKGDILMSVRAPVGPVNFSVEKICIGRGLVAIRPSEKIHPEFLFSILKKMEEEIVGNQGAAFASINKNEIELIQIPLPPLEIQQQIVAELGGYQKNIDELKNKIEQYKEKSKEFIAKLWEED